MCPLDPALDPFPAMNAVRTYPLASRESLVQAADFGNDLSDAQVVALMESIVRMSDSKIGTLNPRLPAGAAADQALRDALACTYLETAKTSDNYPPSQGNPLAQRDISLRYFRRFAEGFSQSLTILTKGRCCPIDSGLEANFIHQFLKA